MRALLVSLLLAGLALVGLDQYLEARLARPGAMPAAAQALPSPVTGQAPSAPDFHVMDGGSGIPPCCN